MKRLLIPTAIAAILLAAPGVAAAHIPNVAADCDSLDIVLEHYEDESPNNRITITVDGASTSHDFGGSFTRHIAWTPTGHSWSVVIDANRNSGHPTEFDRTFQGTEQPCQQPTTTTNGSTTTTTTSAPTTTTPTPTSTSGLPTTTSSPSTSTTVEVGTPPIPSTSTSTTTDIPVIQPIEPLDSPATTELPRTGSNAALLLIALGCVVLGAIGIAVARRRV